jgi:N-methylhydantoinase A
MPATAAVLSASGGLHSDLVADVSASHVTDTRVMDVPLVERLLGGLDDTLAKFRDRVGADDAELVREFSVEARYRFQVWDLEVPLAAPAGADRPLIDPTQIEAGFHRVHERTFGVREEGQTVECVAWRGRGKVALAPPRTRLLPAADGPARPRTTAPAYFAELGTVPTPRFDGTLLGLGAIVDGPAIVELPATTIVVYPGCRARATEHGHLLITTGLEA